MRGCVVADRQQEFSSFISGYGGLFFAITSLHICVRKCFQSRKRLAEREVNELSAWIGKMWLFLSHVTFLPEIQ